MGAHKIILLLMRKILFSKIKPLTSLVVITIYLSACAGVNIPDIIKIPKEEDKERDTPSTVEERVTEPRNYQEFNSPREQVWQAASDAIYWLRWKPFRFDRQDNIIVLKEAYVYEREGSVRRIYTWPPMDMLERSDLRGYLRSVSAESERQIINNAVFTQENMRIRIMNAGGGRTAVTINYEVIPHFRDGSIGNIIASSKHIETLILNYMEKSLITAGTR